MSREQISKQTGRDYGTVQDANSEHGMGQSIFPTSSDYMNFDEMCEEISTNIYKINQGGNKLEKNMQLIGTDRDSVQVRDRIHETSMVTHKLVDKTSLMIKRAVPSRQSDRLRKVQLDRLTTQFCESVYRFKNLQNSATEKVKLTGDVPKPKPKPNLLDDNFGDESTGLMHDERRQEQLQQEEELIQRDLDLIRDREDRVRQLEADILNVNEIFRDLGALVHEQGGTIDLIESNVENAYENVDAGTTQLSKAVEYQKKARKKLCIILVILLIVALIITIIIVTQVQK